MLTMYMLLVVDFRAINFALSASVGARVESAMTTLCVSVRCNCALAEADFSPEGCLPPTALIVIFGVIDPDDTKVVNVNVSENILNP